MVTKEQEARARSLFHRASELERKLRRGEITGPSEREAAQDEIERCSNEIEAIYEGAQLNRSLFSAFGGRQ